MDERAFEEFKWEILGDVALEDFQMTYEPVGVLRTSFPEMDDSARQAIAEQALRELFAEGLIYFFRTSPWPRDLRDAADDPSSRLTGQEVDELLTGDSWRTIPIGRNGAEVEFGATPDGYAAARKRWPVSG